MRYGHIDEFLLRTVLYPHQEKVQEGTMRKNIRRILVAYASKHQATAEIAGSIAQILRQFNELEVDLQPIDKIEFIAGYDAVILGSAVYQGNWRPAAANFLTLHAQELAQIPVWLFSSGPTGEGNSKDLMKGWEFPASLRVIAYQIKPRDIAIFHGKLDLSKLNFLEETVVKTMHASSGDFRNWDEIKQWATHIGQALQKESSEVVS
jgi:menaquinone-dependent protoporphyrinogen oxidase